MMEWSSGDEDRTTSGASNALNPALAAAQALLLALQSSLYDTQRALLTGDVKNLEQWTEKQNSLMHSYLALPDGERAPSAVLAALAARVRELGRIQIVLLSRAQNRHRMLSNLRAGTTTDYARVAESRAAACDLTSATKERCR